MSEQPRTPGVTSPATIEKRFAGIEWHVQALRRELSRLKGAGQVPTSTGKAKRLRWLGERYGIVKAAHMALEAVRSGATLDDLDQWVARLEGWSSRPVEEHAPVPRCSILSHHPTLINPEVGPKVSDGSEANPNPCNVFDVATAATADRVRDGAAG